MLELGQYCSYFDDLEEYCASTTMEYIKKYEDEVVYKDYDTYAARYSNAMTLDFVYNFLPTTTMPMIFVFGENDPWTGCAIPDPKNPNIVKIIVPKGMHNDYINQEEYCPKQTYQQIMAAVNKYVK